MNKETTYSFIIPHKNCPRLLQRCVDSIPVRDDVQVIVVDDNSDADKKPLLDHEGIEIVFLDAEHSKGAGRARNEGLKHAKGKWILFADADDYYTVGFLDILDGYTDRDIDVLYFNFLYKDGKTGEELGLMKFQKYFVEYDESKDSYDEVKYLHTVPWTKMTSHIFLKQYGLYFEEVPNGNDVFFSMCVGYHAVKVAIEKRPIYVYLKNDNSILTSKETPEAALCRLEHLIKCNYFLAYIGHKEWKESVIKRVLIKIKQIGIGFVIELLLSSLNLFYGRDSWARIIPNMKQQQ